MKYLEQVKLKKIIIVGAGEFAAIAHEYFSYDSPYEVAAFSVESAYVGDTPAEGIPVVAFETIEAAFPPSEYEMFVAVPASDLNATRTRLYKAAKHKGYTIASYVSSWSFVWRNAIVGENCFIFEDNTIQPFTQIGNNVVMWSGNHLGHRSVIEDNCFITSHVVISGYCRIGAGSFIGVNATLNDHVDIPTDCIIAAGTHVTKSLKTPAKVYRGSPAEEVPRVDARKIKL